MSAEQEWFGKQLLQPNTIFVILYHHSITGVMREDKDIQCAVQRDYALEVWKQQVPPAGIENG